MVTEEVKTKSTVNNLSDKLYVRPIKKARTYRLLVVGKEDNNAINEKTNLPIISCPPTMLVEGREVIHDSGEEDLTKSYKIIENVTGLIIEEKDGVTVTKKNVDYVEFRNGFFTVFPHQYNTLVFMERSSSNKNNPFRDKNKPAKWEVVDEEKSAEDIFRDEEMKTYALSIAQKCTSEEARAYAKKLEMPSLEQSSIVEVKLFLMNKAKENAEEFIKGSNDTRAKMKLQIYQAKEFKIIEFDADKNKWMLNSPIPNGKKEKREPAKEIVTVGPDEVPEDALINFFQDQGTKGEDYKVMRKAIDNSHLYI